MKEIKIQQSVKDRFHRYNRLIVCLALLAIAGCGDDKAPPDESVPSDSTTLEGTDTPSDTASPEDTDTPSDSATPDDTDTPTEPTLSCDDLVDCDTATDGNGFRCPQSEADSDTAAGAKSCMVMAACDMRVVCATGVDSCLVACIGMEDGACISYDTDPPVIRCETM